MPKKPPLYSHLPSSPGVYLMKDKTGVVLYVGKSRNILSRVRTYFDESDRLNRAKQNMVKHIRAIETIETKNEVEALILETNLIKHLHPKYNVLMKDDKNMAYIRITDDPVPEVVKTRRREGGGEFFGPFPSDANLGALIEMGRKIFHLRSCRVVFGYKWKTNNSCFRVANNEIVLWNKAVQYPKNAALPSWISSESKAFRWDSLSFSPSLSEREGDRGVGLQEGSSKIKEKLNTQVKKNEQSITIKNSLCVLSKAGRSIPCLDYHIGRCVGPCLLTPESLGQHGENLRKFRSFLKWETGAILDGLRADMKKKADAHAYEDAQKIRDTIRALESLRDRQIVRDAFPGNYDIIVILEKYDKVFTSLTQIRNGLVISMERYTLESTIGDEPCELIESFIAREYSEKNNETDPITLLMKEHALGEAIRELLKGRSILVEFPKIGPKAEAIRFAEINLLNYAFQESMKELSRKTISRSTCVSLLSKLGYIAPARGPIVFECFDISHTDGNYTVASKSVIMNGKPSPALYRKYKIRSIPDQQIDDFASIAEVIQRRSTEMREENNAPTFILIDGGKGQLSAALEKLTEAHLDRPPFLASIAKREEEIFVPGNPKSIRLEAGSPELILLQRIRDEAHRFAIGYGKTLRSKAMKKNILEELPWFWPTTRRKLLALIGTVRELPNFDDTQLLAILSEKQLETLKDHGLK